MAGRKILAAATDVLTCLDAAWKNDSPILLVDVFLDHDRIGTGRQGRAREDAHGRARFERGRRLSAARFAVQWQAEIVRRQIGQLHGVAVHGRVVEGRIVDAGAGRIGQIAPAGIDQRHGTRVPCTHEHLAEWRHGLLRGSA